MADITDVGVDLDGVIYPFAEAFHSYCRQRLGTPDLPAPVDWHFYRSWGIADDEFTRYLDDEITEEDGTIRVVTVDQYLTEHEIDRTEVFYATVDEFIAGIASVNIPALDAVDVLLDLRRLFGAVEAEHKEFIRGMHGVIGGLLESQRGAE